MIFNIYFQQQLTHKTFNIILFLMNREQLLKNLQPNHNQHKVSNKEQQVVKEIIPNKSLEVQYLSSNYDDQKFLIEEFIQTKAKNMSLADVYYEIKQTILEQMKTIQKNVYNTMVMNPNQYLQQMLNSINDTASGKVYEGIPMQQISDAVMHTLNKRQQKISNSIKKGQMIIEKDRIIKKKDDLLALQKMDAARLIKIRQGQIKSKIDLINRRFEELDQLEKPKNNINDIRELLEDNMPNAENFKLQSEKTKIAQDYIQHLSEQRKLQRKRLKQRALSEKKAEQERQSNMKQAQSMRKLVKKQQIIEKAKQHKQKRLAEIKQLSQQQSKIKQFLAPYQQSVPLFKKRQKQFYEQYTKPNQRYYDQRIQQLKQVKGKLSLNNLKDHEEKYLKIRQVEIKKILEKRQMEKKIQVPNQFFKSKSYHQQIKQANEERRRGQSMLEIRQNQRIKMKAYDKVVKEGYKPNVDEDKVKEIERRLQEEILKKNKRLKKLYRQSQDPTLGAQGEVEVYYKEIPQKNLYKQGNRFMEVAKAKAKKGFIPSQPEKSIDQFYQEKLKERKSIRLLQQRQRKQKSQDLTQVWSLRAKQLQQISKTPKEFELMKARLESMDRKAAQKEKVLKLGKLSIEEHMKQKGVLDNFYLQAIKGKMKMLDIQQ